MTSPPLRLLCRACEAQSSSEKLKPSCAFLLVQMSETYARWAFCLLFASYAKCTGWFTEREPGCRGSNVVQILYCCTWINVSAISTWLEYFFFRRLFTFTPYTCVQKLCTPVVGKTFLLLLGLKNTNSVQSNLICIHCSCLEVELFEFCCCVVQYMDVDRILEYLGFGGNVQYVFSTWKNKHVENTIGYW